MPEIGNGTITGTVTDSVTGLPVANVCVYADYATGPLKGQYTGAGYCTGASGTYSLTGLPATSYKLAYYLPGQSQSVPSPYWYLNASNEATATPVSVTSGSTTSGINQSLPSA
jgi:hypothetical protein